MNLLGKRCIPCSGGVPKLVADEIASYLTLVPGWQAVDNHHLTRTWRFPDFKSALLFVNQVGMLAEAEAHHPDVHLAWGVVTVDVWTHKIDGLTESDFIFAAKCSRI